MDTARAQALANRVANGGSVALVGRAGSGKSWALRTIARQLEGAGSRVLRLFGSQAAASIPFGVFGDTLPTEFDPSIAVSPSWLAAARMLVRERADVLVIDDADLLDSGSAGLLLERAREGGALLLAVRDLDRAASSLRALVTSGLCSFEELTPLAPEELGDVLATVCAGPIDARAILVIGQLSGGLPFAAVAICRMLRDSGALNQYRGVWVLEQGIELPGGLDDPVALRINELSETERDFVDVLALAETLSLDVALRMADQRTLESLETSGIVAVDGAPDLELRLAHEPLREVTLRRLPALRRRRLAGQLLEALEPSPAIPISPTSRLVRAELALAAGRPPDATEVSALADLVESISPARCEHLLRALADAPAAARTAQLRLVRFLLRQARLEEAESRLDALALQSPADDDGALTLLRIELLSSKHPDQRAALALLERALSEPGLGRAAASRDLQLARCRALLRAGGISAAVRCATAIATDHAAPLAARLAGAQLWALAEVYAGDREGHLRARQLYAELCATDQQCPQPDGPETLALLDASAALMLGRPLDEAEALARAGYDRALVSGDDGVRSQFATELGWIATLRGDPVAGDVLLRQAQAMRGPLAPGSRPWILALRLQTLVLAGEHQQAGRLAAEIRAVAHFPIYAFDVAVALGLQLSLESIPAAREQLAWTAVAAATAGHHYLARVARYDAARLGSRASAQAYLAMTAPHHSSTDEALRRHAAAVRGGDAEDLDRAGLALEEAGFRWYAVEAWAAAAQAHRHAGDRPAAQRAAARGQQAQRAGSLNVPLLAALTRPALTQREAEIARLAAGGWTDQRIADQAGLSLRTVHAHLRAVYAKLGIAGRRQLTEILIEPGDAALAVEDPPLAPVAADLEGQAIPPRTEPEWEVAEIVAVAERAPRALVEQVAGREAVWRACAADLVSDHAGWLQLGARANREAIVGDTGRLRRRAILETLLAALDAAWSQNADPELPLARTLWRAATGIALPSAEVLEAIEIAGALGRDLPTSLEGQLADPQEWARVLARLAQFHVHRHNTVEALRLLAEAEQLATEREEKVVLTASRAMLFAQPANRPADALDLLAETGKALGNDVRLDLARSTASWRSGDLAASLAIALPLATDTSMPPAVRAHAALDSLATATLSGDLTTWALAEPVAIATVTQARSELPEAEGSCRLMATLMHLQVRGDLPAAQQLSAQGYRVAELARDTPTRQQWAHLAGWLAHLDGRSLEALDLLGEALAATGLWADAMRAWVGSHYVQAAVSAGRRESAAEVLELLATLPHSPIHEVDLDLARAALLAAHGLPGLAGRACALSAARSAARGHLAMAIIAGHEGVLYGDRQAARQLLSLFEKHPHLASLPRNLAFATSARLLLKMGSVSADETALQLEAVGQMDAARRLREAVPTEGEDSARPLTDREAEFALLAARGLSDRQIAEAGGVSVRTVESHLSHAYAKLGIAGREGLTRPSP